MGEELSTIDLRSDPTRYPLTVRDFVMLHEAGAFDQVGRVELIEGEILQMAPMHRPHARIVPLLSIALDRAIGMIDAGLEVLAEPSAELDTHSLPQADIVVADIADEKIVSRGTVRLLVEVAATSLGYDLGRKKRLYARAEVPEYWVADVDGRRIIRFHAPTGEDFAERAEFAFGDPIPSATIPGLVVDTSRLV
ncbi:Uma2 family endonuclease [Sphingomonas bacterium]|uniref:Uma2 family endonuclease n=1 Tax=Sphingomonas bacterium TaxID=1895847 RepID=UPI001575DF13|nr:Uma2 family endonuclease [Sphingomonas bacterium]